MIDRRTRGLRQNRVTTVGRALSGTGSAVGYCGLGLLIYGGALPLALAGMVPMYQPRFERDAGTAVKVSPPGRR